MPRVNLGQKGNPRRGIIEKYATSKGWDGKRIDRELQISTPTRCSRMKDVDTFKVGDLRKILNGCEISRKEAAELYGIKITD